MVRAVRRKAIDACRRMFRLGLLEQALVTATNGKPYGGVVSKLAPSPSQYPAPTWREAERYGFRLGLDLSDAIQWYVYFGFADTSHEQLLALCQRGNVVIDVGANVGITALRLSTCVGPEGRVYALEPDPTNFRRLRENCARNGASNVRLFEQGAGSRPMDALLATPDPNNRGRNQIETVPSGGAVERVSLTTLDRLVDEAQIARVDLIKIDTEGFECEVLAGAEATLRRDHPTIFAELSDRHLRQQGRTASQLVAMLIAWGYRVRRADTGQHLTTTSDFENVHCDLVATAVTEASAYGEPS